MRRIAVVALIALSLAACEGPTTPTSNRNASTSRASGSGVRCPATTGVTIRNLGALPGGEFSFGVAVNNKGAVAGYSVNGSRDGYDFAFLWTPDRGLGNLGTLPCTVSSEAADINDRGQVVGESSTADGKVRAVLWTRTANSSSAPTTND